jgi:hypothetical protein
MSIPALRVEHSHNSIRIFRGTDMEPILVQQAQVDQRPFIHPILAPDGKGVLTENTPSHHPWQHGLYVGLNDVNGIGFWEEGLRNKPEDGSFHPQPLKPATVSSHRASWEVETYWRDPQGILMIKELQQWSLHDRGSTFEIDLQWSLRAEVDLLFGQKTYGGLFLRMPYRDEWGGKAFNSEGLVNNDAEGERARWMACYMPIEGRPDQAGCAILDHPNNPEHPVPWRVDRTLGISPSRCIAGSWTLPQGETQINQYRIVVFTGAIAPSAVDVSWQQFASSDSPHPNRN